MGCVAFTYISGDHSATAPMKRAFQQLCFAILFNFPHMLLQTHGPYLLRPYSQSIQQHHSWQLDERARVEHRDATPLTARHDVTCSAELDNLATSGVKGLEAVCFHATPRFSRLVQLWGGTERWPARRKRYYAFIAVRRRRKGEAARDASALTGDGGPVHRGATALEWSDFKRLAGLNTFERQIAYRLKAGRVSSWNPTTGNLACPMPGCSSSQASVAHIFWE